MIRKSVQNLTPYTPGEQPKLAKLIKLNTNENAYPPSPKVGQALASLDFERLRLYPDPLCIRIRELLAAEFGCGIDNIFVGNGSDEVLSLATEAFTENDGTIGFFNPSYSLYPVLADIRDAKQVEIPLPASSDELAVLSKNTKLPDLFFLTNPNAPTSTIFSLEAIEDFCKNTDSVVIVDEAYGDFSKQKSATTLISKYPNLLVCRTLSKSYSLAGIRLGYLVGNTELIEALYKIKDSYNVNMLTQVAAIAALEDPEWMKENCKRICATRDRIKLELRNRGWFVAESETNFLWAKPPAPLTAPGVRDALRAEGIIIRYFSQKETAEYIRITIGTDEQMDEMLKVIDSCK